MKIEMPFSACFVFSTNPSLQTLPFLESPSPLWKQGRHRSASPARLNSSPGPAALTHTHSAHAPGVLRSVGPFPRWAHCGRSNSSAGPALGFCTALARGPPSTNRGAVRGGAGRGERQGTSEGGSRSPRVAAVQWPAGCLSQPRHSWAPAKPPGPPPKPQGCASAWDTSPPVAHLTLKEHPHPNPLPHV